MKRLRTLFAGTAFATCLAITGPVSADLPVIDISSLKQSILTAAHTLQEVNNQITQIQQFVQMLQNEARNLLSLPNSALQQITGAIDQVNSLMRQAQSLAYDAARIDQQFEQLFPNRDNPEFRVFLQTRFHDLLVLFRFQRAGGVDQPPCLADVFQGGVEV